MCHSSEVPCCWSHLESLGKRRCWNMFCAGSAPTTVSEPSILCPGLWQLWTYPTFLLYNLARLKGTKWIFKAQASPAGLPLLLSFTSACNRLASCAVCSVQAQGLQAGKCVRLRYAGGYISHKRSGSHCDLERTLKGAESVSRFTSQSLRCHWSSV